MSQEKKGDDSGVVLGHLSNLPLLGSLVERFDELLTMVKTRRQLRQVFPSVSLGMDYPFTFDAHSIYIDNLTNTDAVTVQFDNEPLAFQVPASAGRFLPCGGSKQFRVNGTASAGATVNVMVVNREMGYN